LIFSFDFNEWLSPTCHSGFPWDGRGPTSEEFNMTTSKYFTAVMGPVTVVRFTEAELFDSILVSELGEELIEFCDTAKPSRLVLDFSEVRFCSTSLINTLLRVKKIVTRDNPGQLKFCHMSSNVSDAFVMLNLAGSVFAIHDTLNDAEAAFDP